MSFLSEQQPFSKTFTEQNIFVKEYVKDLHLSFRYTDILFFPNNPFVKKKKLLFITLHWYVLHFCVNNNNG